VCGRPREGALEALSAAEPFDRGFYSGPFGWISGAAAEFAVAIRSALVHGNSSMTEPATPASAANFGAHLGTAPSARSNNVGLVQNGDSIRQDSSAVPAQQMSRSSFGAAAVEVPDRHSKISMYAGVGLVCGSDAEKEWQVRYSFCVLHNSWGLLCPGERLLQPVLSAAAELKVAILPCRSLISKSGSSTSC